MGSENRNCVGSPSLRSLFRFTKLLSRIVHCNTEGTCYMKVYPCRDRWRELARSDLKVFQVSFRLIEHLFNIIIHHRLMMCATFWRAPSVNEWRSDLNSA